MREKSEDLEYLIPERKVKAPETFLEKVTEILAYYDPVELGYIAEDEYDIEAEVIIHCLGDVTDLTEMRWMVYNVFARWFSETSILPSGNSCYRYIAEEVWNAWEEEVERLELEKSTVIFGKNN